MKKNVRIGLFGAIAVMIIAVVIALVVLYKTKDDNGMEKKFCQAMKNLNTKVGQEISWNEVVPFTWDEVYYFVPYTTEKEMEQITGVKSDKYCELHEDSGVQIAFIKNKKVIVFISDKEKNLGFGMRQFDCIKYKDEALFQVEKNGNTLYIQYISSKKEKEQTESKEDAKQQFLDNISDHMYYAEMTKEDGSFILLVTDAVIEDKWATSCDVYYGKDKTIRFAGKIQSEEPIAGENSMLCLVEEGKRNLYTYNEETQKLENMQAECTEEILEFREIG